MRFKDQLILEMVSRKTKARKREATKTERERRGGKKGIIQCKNFRYHLTESVLASPKFLDSFRIF